MQEKLLFQAMDFQRFAGNTRLQAVIDASHARTTLHRLSDDDLELVAGGIREMPYDQNKPEESQK